MKLNGIYSLHERSNYYLLALELNCGFELDGRTVNKISKINKMDTLLPFYNLYKLGRAYD